jgi:hypothetical protein
MEEQTNARHREWSDGDKDQPLPNKVVEWLRFKSLALLIVPRKSRFR